MSRDRSAWSAVATLIRFECRWQSRDFFAWLAAAVLFWLALGFASTGVVALVGDLGRTPRNAPWAIAHAMAGVTAFGQVITAITAATTVLRDVVARTQALVLTTGVAWRHYLGGRFLGTLTVLLVIYLSLPVGLLLGDAIAAWRGDPQRVAFSAASYVAPLLGLVLPNVIVVAAIFFCIGALAGGFGSVLTTGLALVACWQFGMGLVARGAAWGALVDPFGSAALLGATATWTAAERVSAHVPLGGWLLVNRALWLSLALIALSATLRWWRPALPLTAQRGTSRSRTRADTPATAMRPLRGASAAAVWCAEWRFGWHWVTREPGFAILLLLAVLNATAQAWPVSADPSALLRALEFHGRLFAILIATIYAGELLWRDHDVGAALVLSALPAAPRVRLDGRAVGVLCGLLLLPVALWLLAVLLPLWRGAAPVPRCAAQWLLGVATAQFIVLFVLSVIVHRVLRHKTVAHLLLISAWIVAIALGADALARPWTQWGHC